MSDLLDLAQSVVDRAIALGADEAAATLSSGSHATLVRRDGRVEQATEATSRGLSVSLFVDEKASSHSTSDLRPEALDGFLQKALDATRYLEPDPDQRQPDPELCGRGATEDELDQDDPSWLDRTPEQRAKLAEAMEQQLSGLRTDDVISGSTWCADGRTTTARVMSNGFSGEHTSAGYSLGGDVTLDEGNGKRPEAGAYYGARHLSDLPDPDHIAAEVMERARERVGAKAIESGTYPMILLNRAAGRMLGMFGGPLSGSSLFEKRSCLDGKVGEAIASKHLTLIDDPLVPRGLGSRPWDGDALAAKKRTIIENGVLQQYYIGVYYGRRLGVDPTTGGRSNWVVPPGERSWEDLAKGLDKAILVNSFLGGNANPITGDFSYGIRGVLVENGAVTQSLAEMNVSGNLMTLFHKLSAVGNDPWEWSSARIPSLIFEDIQFSGT
ncbi:MAG: TldD/PmbA family protein [Myxococcota bacterium]